MTNILSINSPFSSKFHVSPSNIKDTITLKMIDPTNYNKL